MLGIKKYLFISIICFLFSFIYEYFSHNIYSIYMIIPGFIVIFLGLFSKFFTNFSLKLYNSFISSLIVGLYLLGILEIFGTTNKYVKYYFYIAVIFLVLSIFTKIIKK